MLAAQCTCPVPCADGLQLLLCRQMFANQKLVSAAAAKEVAEAKELSDAQQELGRAQAQVRRPAYASSQQDSVLVQRETSYDNAELTIITNLAWLRAGAAAAVPYLSLAACMLSSADS